jgi:hypothetical protein
MYRPALRGYQSQYSARAPFSTFFSHSNVAPYTPVSAKSTAPLPPGANASKTDSLSHPLLFIYNSSEQHPRFAGPSPPPNETVTQSPSLYFSNNELLQLGWWHAWRKTEFSIEVSQRSFCSQTRRIPPASLLARTQFMCYIRLKIRRHLGERVGGCWASG